MRKDGMKRSITANPDPTYREAAANIKKEARAAERERLAAEQKKRGLKAVRVILAAKHMLKNHGFEFVGKVMIRDQTSGKEYKEGGIR